MQEHMAHVQRYRRSREFVEVVRGLWDSLYDHAFLRDQSRGNFFGPEKMHLLDPEGEFFSVRGPLNIVRPVQGYTIVV